VNPSLLLLPILAFLPQEPKMVSLTYLEGESINANVLELKGDSVRLRVYVLGGSMQVVRKLADFTPASILLIELAANPPSGFDGHFRMAKRAAELRLLPQAGGQCRAAVEAVKNTPEAQAKTKEVRGWAAAALEKMVQDAVAAENLAEARNCLKLLSTRLPDMRTEEQMDALAASVDALDERVAGKKAATRQAKLDAKAREQMNARLEKVRQGIASGDKQLREAVAKSRSTAKSSNLCEKAIDAYKAAWKLLQDLLEQNADDAELAREASSLTQQMHDNAIRAALHAANMLTVQSDYKGAMDWANRVLAFDPGNAEAKDMVKTIQIAEAAAAGEWGWGWRTAGSGGPAVDPRKY
jgi:tetratricopeptide (TPR) repeat protein